MDNNALNHNFALFPNREPLSRLYRQYALEHSDSAPSSRGISQSEPKASLLDEIKISNVLRTEVDIESPRHELVVTLILGRIMCLEQRSRNIIPRT